MPGVPEASSRTRHLTTSDVADFLGVTTDGVRKLIASGRLPCERRRSGDVRTTYLPTRDEVLAYLSAYDPSMIAPFVRRWP